MQVILFVLGTIVIQGGLVLFLWLLTAGYREAHREEKNRRRLAFLEAEEERLRRAAHPPSGVEPITEEAR